ncbi:MAG: Fpg/Nei family glycosylase [Frankiales bacterium]|nr:Fpg/Nei family glycosylase [Frankiales bacterium]
MPEGDTVWLAAQRLHDALAGRVLTTSDFRVPQLATTDLTGREVLSVTPRGKHLLTRIEGGLTLHTHFRMDGTWHLYRPGERRRGGPDWQVRVVLTNAEWEAVGYRLPVVELLATADEARAVGHLGPDVLGPDWDVEEAVRRLRSDPAREIGMALLDQRNLAGLGNLYRIEILFLRGLTPWLPVSEVPDLRGLVEVGRRLMLANRGRIEQSTTGSLRRGETHWVFERTGRPCRRCSTPIASAEQGEVPYQRLSYWCPHCQLGPAPASSTARPPRPAGRTRYTP